MHKKVVFKPYQQHQLSLLPPSYDELIGDNHPVRVVNAIVDRLDIKSLEKKYAGGGASSYHPRMFLKVIIYSYLRNIYSSRKIEQALQENIHFMWLSGGATPDHGTINDFRSKRLKEDLKKIFNQVVLLLAEEGVLSLKELYVDGTKIEANANRYTFVWANSIKYYKEKMRTQLNELWNYIERVYQDEEQRPNQPDFKELDPDKVQQTIDQINQALQGKEVPKKIKNKLKYAAENWPNNLKKYAAQEQVLGSRNSFSKIDTDATFMRMKEDHMRNGQLKAAYNIQASTNNQYLTNYSLHPNPTDTTTLPKHLAQHIADYNQTPQVVTADAGYGSEENYQYLADNNIEAFVKYNYFHKDQTDKKRKNNPFLPDNLFYNADTDTYYCTMGQAMKNIGSRERETATGYKQHIDLYQASNCQGCPMRVACHKSKSNRIIERNHNLIKHKNIAKEKLLSEEGIAHRKRRCWDVEAVFGNIKQNMNFKRFMLRGIEKASLEIGLIAIAHNLKKYSNQKQLIPVTI